MWTDLSLHPLLFTAKGSEEDKSHASSGPLTEAGTWNLTSGNFLRPWNRMRAGMDGENGLLWPSKHQALNFAHSPPDCTRGVWFSLNRASVLHQHFVRWGGGGGLSFFLSQGQNFQLEGYGEHIILAGPPLALAPHCTPRSRVAAYVLLLLGLKSLPLACHTRLCTWVAIARVF